MGRGSRIGRILFGLAILAVIGLGTTAFFTPVAQAKGPCICPKIYAPVVCDNGKTYPNQCVANCRHAKNCVPTGGI